MSNAQILPEDIKEVLTEESILTIEEAIKDKMSLSVESALTAQDELYAEKLTELIATIDKDHTAKLKRIVEAVDRNNAEKLVKVVKKYEKEVQEDAQKFKNTIVESISEYLEEFIDEAVPAEAILEATQNRTAMEVLGNLRSVLAIDSALMQESVKDAVVDGKTRISDLEATIAKVEKENNLLKEAYERNKAELVLESKITSLPEKKKEYLKRVLSDKSAKFIEENFDYTLRLFDKKEKERIDVIKEEAFDGRTVKADAPVIKESATEDKGVAASSNPYLSELARFK